MVGYLRGVLHDNDMHGGGRYGVGSSHVQVAAGRGNVVRGADHALRGPGIDSRDHDR